MTSLLLDTHAIIWFLEGAERLSMNALKEIRSRIVEGEPVLVSAVSIIEVTYLVEKRKLPPSSLERLDHHLAQVGAGIGVVPTTMGVAQAVRRIPREIVPDMPDRIIAATALHLACPLVTCDRRLKQANLQVIW